VAGAKGAGWAGACMPSARLRSRFET
jgi:hypothetical protein